MARVRRTRIRRSRGSAPMTGPASPQVDCDRHHTNLSVPDVRLAADFYGAKLGFRVDFTDGNPPDFAGVSLGRAQIFLSAGTPSPEGCSVYFVIGDADELHEVHRSNGVAIVDPPADRPYGLRDYAVQDLDGYRLRFGHHIYSGGPPLPIERVDVPVRLEKRLAALLRDLAEHKRMSLGSCLEEILLHTCEPLGDGVASPHTRRTLRYIQELKKKHGIDYDCHASYRFTENEP
jgi:catechol 2,3-dioxygenase-like lactoylglutathione lyase family enzyme